MEVFYIICISLLGFFLLYILVKNRISIMMETRLKELYRDKISTDIQDFYRELESYSAIIDNRIGRLKTLTERHEANIKAWEKIQVEMKKTKTGREFLSYLDENAQSQKMDKKSTGELKDEIIGELKKYLAAKLNLSSEPAESNMKKPVRPESPEVKPDKQRDEADSQFNVAELIINEMDASTIRRDQNMTKAPYFDREQKPENKSQTMFNLPEKPEKRGIKTSVSGQPDNEYSNMFLNILTSVGRALSPLFIKSQNISLQNDTRSNIETTTASAKNFNNLLRKEINTSGEILQIRNNTPESPRENRKTGVNEPGNVEKNDAMEINSQKLVKSMQPAELVKLIEEIKVSRSRPEALKHLLNQGFQMEQIAELSNVPFSDLELTRNLYHI